MNNEVSKKRDNRLLFVIHTECEFDWNGGFYQDDAKVSHAEELIAFVTKLATNKIKVVLAVDYVFVNSPSGQQALNHLLTQFPDLIEIGTHLQPWNTPPFLTLQNEVAEVDSFPGNLSYEQEFNKLATLTQKVHEITGRQPVTYLAGRYGIGKNTYTILKELNYLYDISVSPLSDFSQQSGPNYSKQNSTPSLQHGIRVIPHSSGVLTAFDKFTRKLNQNLNWYNKLNSSLIGKVMLKLSMARWVRVSPEGETAKDTQQLAKALLSTGQQHVLYSLHSPSLKAGLTPYVRDEKERQQLVDDALVFCQYAVQTLGLSSSLLQDIEPEWLTQVSGVQAK